MQLKLNKSKFIRDLIVSWAVFLALLGVAIYRGNQVDGWLFVAVSIPLSVFLSVIGNMSKLK